MPDERNEKIDRALLSHHNMVKRRYKVVMTVLCGSQNYGLDTENSDYDTYTFVLPTLTDIAMLKDATSTLEEDEYGHINIKDIRLALNLLRKTSPNSVEWFATPYRIIEPEYEDLIKQYITPEALRCDAKNMMNAIAGLAHQLTKRNMPPGKRYSHMIRMECMVDNYYLGIGNILGMPETCRRRALAVKTNPDMSVWDERCLEQEEVVKAKIASYKERFAMIMTERIGNAKVNMLQKELMSRYLRSELKMPVMSLYFSPEKEVWNNV